MIRGYVCSIALVIVVGWSGVAHATLSVSPAPAFGDVGVTAGASTINETIESSAVDELATIQLGAGCGPFTVVADNPLPQTITTATPLPITITFDPVTRGSLTCTVTLLDAGSVALGTFQITGKGIAPAVSVPASTDFGAVRVSTGATQTQNVAVQNTGEQTLTVSALSIAGADYTINSPATPFNIGSGGSTNVNITFDPSATGTRNAILQITSNDPTVPMATAVVTGVGVEPAITGPASVAFGAVEVGKTSGPQPLTITNTGTSTLTITSAVVQAGDYAATGTAGTQTVAPNATASWNVTCSPTAQGPRPGTFRITSDAANAAQLDVPLTCEGTRGFLEVDPTTLAFGGVPQDGTSTLNVLLKNTGNLPVTGITAAINPNNVGYTIVGSVPTTLAANTNATVQIRFAPTAAAAGGNATVTFAGSWGAAPASTTTALLALTGTRLTTGYTVSATAFDFGNFRYDLTPTRKFCITNTGQQPVTIGNPISFVPTGGTASNEFAIAGIAKQTTCGTAGTTVSLPQTLATGEILEVTVRAQAANRLGPLTGNLTITSDLPSNPNRTVALAANSITAMLTMVPGPTVNFGNVDIQGGAQMMTVRIRNTGVAPLDVGNFTRTANAAFTFTLPATQTIAPNSEAMFAVTYAPTVALAADETVTITHSIAGDIALPALGVIVLRGRPIDRDLSIIGGNPLFPDTFRNPGAAGPVRTVSVKNTGTAPLLIASVSSTDPDVWKVLDPDPITVPPDATMDIRIRFEPTAPGLATARLQIVNDDDDDGPPITQKTTEVQLTGICADRRVAFGPATINLGYVELGQTFTIKGALLVANNEGPTVKFTIARIGIEGGDGAFTTDAVDGMPLDRMEELDVTFTPTTAGPITAKARLFLDEDPVHQSEVELQGTAVFVDARGGGGCATGYGTSAGALALVLLFVLRRRRAALVAIALLSAAAPSARADDNVSLSVFEPTPQTASDGFQLQSPAVGSHGAIAFNAVYSYAADPLLHLASSGTEHGVITGSSMLEIGVAIALLGNFELAAAMPFYSQTGEELGDRNTEYTTAPVDGTAAGDLRVHGKVGLVEYSLAGNGSFALAGSIGLTLPTATGGMLTGADNPSARVLALGSLVPGAFSNRVTISTNLGAIIRAAAKYKNLEQKSGIMWGLGASVRVADPLWITGEMFGEFVPSGREKMDGSSTLLAPIEWLGGLRWRPDHRFMVSIAAGRGLTSAAGAPALRGVFALTFTPYAAAIKPIQAPPPPKPDVDTDGDNIVDRLDTCADEPEDIDLFDDTDGCPELDNDKDGVADAMDRCPLGPEDKDNFQDDDGCVEKDNDADLIVDAMDKCPIEVEDRDGFQDSDGCPEPDNDLDGVVDASDRCPGQKEVINGNQDDDGCPDKGISLVLITLDRIDLMESIQFAKDKLKPASYNLLGQIGATLRAHPEILRVRVAVHVTGTNDEAKDQQLSEKRAQALREWLVQWGIAAERLDVRGFGSTKPLGGSAAADERIEIVIMEKK